MRNTRTLILVEVALAVALSAVLNLLAMRLPFNIAGGSISLTMLPIVIVALRRGPLAGLVAGAIFGFLDLLMEPFILVPAQVALDYPVPYLLLGLGVGIFAPLYQRLTSKAKAATPAATPPSTPAPSEAATHPGTVLQSSAVAVLAVLFGGTLRYLTHVLSGVLFFSEYAGDQNVWAYSLIYNISYLGPSLAASLVCALVILPILAHAVPVTRLQHQQHQQA
jgi:thiamine transporter